MTSIDAARGLMIALMALDHVRMYLTSAHFDPLAIGETTPGYFVTRWVTHLCAPGFFFLAGLAVHLAEIKTPSWRSSMLLFVRGSWLLLLEFSVIGFAWSFTIGWSWFGVIWSLGSSMICLGLLRWIPKQLLLLSAGLFLVTHNSLPIKDLLGSSTWSHLLYSGEDAFGRWVLFPVLPWLSIMVLGYAGGKWLMPGGEARLNRFLVCGVLGVVGFVICRAIGFGQPPGGGIRRDLAGLDRAMSFMNVEKYPPSTQYVLITLGLLLLVIAAIDAAGRRKSLSASLGSLVIFGRVPLFFYVSHIFMIHALACLIVIVLGWPTSGLVWRSMPGQPLAPGYGFGLLGVYVAWSVVLAVLLPLCGLVARVKSRSAGFWTKLV